MHKVATLYVHGDKDIARELWRELGGPRDGEAASSFAHAGMEVGLEILVDMDTGHSECIGLRAGPELVPLAKPVLV